LLLSVRLEWRRSTTYVSDSVGGLEEKPARSKEFTLGYTKLITDAGRWIIVPNSTIASNTIIRVK
jgi:hypothetical protein